MSTLGVIPRLKAHIPNNSNHPEIHTEHSVQTNNYQEFARIIDDSSNDLHSISVTPLDHHSNYHYHSNYTPNSLYSDRSQIHMSTQQLPPLIPPNSPQSLASPQKYHLSISPQITSPQKYQNIPPSPQSHQQHQNLIHQAPPIKPPYTIHHSPQQQQLNNSPHKFHLVPVNESPPKYVMQSNISPQHTSPPKYVMQSNISPQHTSSPKLQQLQPPQMSPQSMPYHHPSPVPPQSHPSPHSSLHHHNNNYHTSPLPSLTPANNLSQFHSYNPTGGYLNTLNSSHHQQQQINEPEPSILDERYDPYSGSLNNMNQMTPGAMISSMGGGSGGGLSESNYSASVSSDDLGAGSNTNNKRNAPTLATGRRNLKQETVDEDEAVRRLKRRERNRKSAQKCRERKLILTKELKSQVDQLKQDQNYVVMELNQLVSEARQVYDLFQARCNHNIQLPLLSCLSEPLTVTSNNYNNQCEQQQSYQSNNDNTNIMQARPELIYMNESREQTDNSGRSQNLVAASHLTSLNHLDASNHQPTSQHMNWANSYPTMTTSSSSGSQLSPPDMDIKMEMPMTQEFA